MAASPPLTVVVVGAGLGGLLCANGLVHGIRDAPTTASDDATASPAADPAPVSSDAVTDEPHVSATTGMRVIVLERDESAHSRAQGYYIGVQGDGLDAIGQVGLRDKVLENVKPGEGPFVFATASGTCVFDVAHGTMCNPPPPLFSCFPIFLFLFSCWLHRLRALRPAPFQAERQQVRGALHAPPTPA